MTDRVPRLPLTEVRQLVQDFGLRAVEEALQSAKQDTGGSRGEDGSVGSTSTNSADFDKFRIQEAMLEASFDASFAVNQKGIIQHVNQAAVRQFGYDSKDEIIGQNIQMIVGGGHAQHHDQYLQNFKETRLKNFIGSLREVRGRRKDGTEFPCIIGLEVIESYRRQDKLLYYASIRDITKEKEIQQQQNLRSAILDASFDAFFAIDLNGTIKMVNKVAVDIFGYNSDEDFLGKNIKMIVGDGHAQHHDDYLRHYRETGERKIIGSMREVKARKSNGEEFPVNLGIVRIEQEDSDDPLMVAFVRDITKQKKATELEIEIRAAEELLCNMLPEEIANRLKLDPQHLADHHEKATILFADIVGFTAMSSNMSPVDLVAVLNELFTRFDKLVDQYGLNKVKTIGDCYMVTSIPSYQDPDNAAGAMCHLSLDMIDALKQFNVDHPANKLDLRVGLNTGPVVAGVVGTSRFLYDLWGDTVNVASRMESTGVPSRVQVTKAVVDNIDQDSFVFESRGKIQCKGKGLIDTFMLEKRLQPRDKYLLQNIVDVADASLDQLNGNASPVFQKSFRRRSTLQEALVNLQSQLEVFNASFGGSTSFGGNASFGGRLSPVMRRPDTESLQSVISSLDGNEDDADDDADDDACKER